MADRSSTYLIEATHGDGLKFRSTESLCLLLGISQPYRCCTAYAPYARNAPHCSRPVNRSNQARVSGLLAELVNVDIPSSRSACLLKTLSTCVVCGITGWHQNKAVGIYESWVEKLWVDYLWLNHLEPSQCDWVPHCLTKAEWERSLETVQAEQDYDLGGSSSDDFGESESISSETEDEDDALEEVFTPDSSYSDIIGGSSGQETLSDNVEAFQSHPESSAASQQSSRATFSVYHDPAPYPESRLRSNTEVGPSSQPLSSSRASTSLALRRLDPNIPIHHATNTNAHATDYEGSESSLTDTADCSETDSLADDEEESYGDQKALHNRPTSILAVPATSGETASEADAIEAVDSDHNAETDEEGEEDLGDGSQWSLDDVQRDQISPEQDTSSDAAGPEDDFPAELLSLLELTDANDEDGNATNTEVQPTPSPQPSVLTTRNPFHPYPQLVPLRLFKTLLNQLTQTVSHRYLGPGYIYAYTRPSASGHLKIGYTSERAQPPPPRHPRPHPVDDRLAQWVADCGRPVQEVFRVRVPCAVRRIESLIHTVLRSWRRVEDPPCGRCASRRGRSGAHDEWFEVDEGMAKAVVELWARFSEERPYDGFGRLVDFWSTKVARDRRDVQDEDTVRGWLDGMPRMVEELRREELRNMIGPLETLSLY